MIIGPTDNSLTNGERITGKPDSAANGGSFINGLQEGDRKPAVQGFGDLVELKYGDIRVPQRLDVRHHLLPRMQPAGQLRLADTLLAPPLGDEQRKPDPDILGVEGLAESLVLDVNLLHPLETSLKT